MYTFCSPFAIRSFLCTGRLYPLPHIARRAIFARMLKTFLLFLGSAISGAVAIMATTPKREVVTNLGSYFTSLPDLPTWVDPIVIAISVMAASILFGAGVIRITQPSPLQRLAELRSIGVGLRNRRVNTEEELSNWLAEGKLWRESVIAVAQKASRLLAHRLDPLNEVYRFPANSNPLNNKHARYLGIVSEILRRIEKYMEENQ